MTTHYSLTKVQLLALDGRELAHSYFHSVGRAWEWVTIVAATKFECSEDEIDCEGPDDSDPLGLDYVTVNGKRVARTRMIFPWDARREFKQAAE